MKIKNLLHNEKLQRLLVTVLLAASLLTLFLPWQTFRVGGMTLETLLTRATAASGTGAGSVSDALQLNILRGSGLGASLDLLIKGRISPVQQAAAMARSANAMESMSGFAGLGIREAAQGGEIPADALASFGQRTVSWAADQVRLNCALNWLAMLLMAALLALGLWSFFRGRRLGLIPYGAAVLFAVGSTLLHMMQVNSFLNLYGDLLQSIPALSDVLLILGIRSVRNPFGLGVGAWLCLLLTAAGLALSLIKTRSPREQQLADWWAPASPAVSFPQQNDSQAE